MAHIVEKFKNIFNRDLLYTGFNQLWRLVSGPIVLTFIPLFLTAEVQGYWFTFISLSALSVFADLGFTNIVLQFSAHEFAFLKFTNTFIVEGDDEHLKKLASFLVFILKWVSIMITVAFPIILLIGIVFFSQKQVDVDWIWPWIIYSIGAAINYFNNSILSFIEGCNQVGTVQKIRFHSSIINTVIILGLLFFHLKLFALALSLFISSSVIFIFIIKNYKDFIKQLLFIGKNYKYSWNKEFMRLFWRYALSFSSGFLMYQIYTPLAFKFYGPTVAGKIGLTLTLWTAIFSVSNIWVYSVTPKLNMYVSTKQWGLLDRMFFRNMSFSLFTFLLSSITVLSIFFYFKDKLQILNRLSDTPVMLSLFVVWFLQLIINTLAIYLRAHKQEPLVIPSVVTGVYVSITTFLCAKYLQNKYMFVGFLSSYLLMIPWVIIIFLKKRELWHFG